MTRRGIARFDSPTFGIDEAAQIVALIQSGRRDEADEALRHHVHLGVPPSVLFEMAMALARRRQET